MTRLRLRSIRRSLAVLLLLCFGLYGIESEVADVHERAPAAGAQGHLHQSDTGSIPDEHPVHVCHCAHTHLLALASAPGLEMVVTPQMDGSWRVPAGLPGTHPLPRLRPPIA